MRRLVLLLLATSGLALGACSPFGSSTSTTTTTLPAITTATLCSSIPRIDQLIVTRHVKVAGYSYTFHRIIRVTDAQAAQRVASAMCALPNLPYGTHCSAALAVSYTLQFGYSVPPPSPSMLRQSEAFVTFTMEPTGCQVVIGTPGVASARWIAQRQSFYRVLGDAMGIRSASLITFAGYGPTALRP